MITTREFWLDAAIRAGRTFLIVFSSMFISFNTLGDFPFWQAGSAAAFAAILSLVTSLAGIPETAHKKRAKWLAVLERTTKTFFQSLVAVLPSQVIYLSDVSWLEVFQVSMTAAVGSLLYGLLSVLPEETDQRSLVREA